jgi:RNA polymerase sigma factor (sigma-70 family)
VFEFITYSALKKPAFLVTILYFRSLHYYRGKKPPTQLSELTDNEVMLLVKTGDLDKMKILFRRHSRSLYGFLFHMTYNKEASEDMVQNVFYRMLKYRNTFVGNGDFIIWMFHLARNILKDHLKKQQRTGIHYDIGSISEKIGGGVLADERLGRKQAQLQLYRAMEKLREEDREIITLNKFQELKYHEIAKILSITEGAVKVRVHRAFTQLKNIYLKMESYEM